MDHCETVVVGAGPAGLAAAIQLTTRGEHVLLLDAGRLHRARICPVDRGLHCNGCKGICNVISGFGGALHFGDAAKFSLLPAGRRLLGLFGEERAWSLCNVARDLLRRFTPGEPHMAEQSMAPAIKANFQNEGLIIREYPVLTFSENQVKSFIHGAFGYLNERGVVALREGVGNVSQNDGIFEIKTSRGRTILSRAVVLATGRSGFSKTQQLLREWALELRAPIPSVGVRFELPLAFIRDVGGAFPDLKVSSRKASGKTKTFCFSAGPGGGRIKFCHYQGSFSSPVIFLDGHAVVHSDTADEGVLPANFAVMHQIEANGLDKFWAALVNRYVMVSAGRPIAQTYLDFRDGTAPDQTWIDLKATLPFSPSVQDFLVGPLHELFESDVRRSLCETFEHVVRCSQSNVLDFDVDRVRKATVVCGPEVEFFWDQVRLDSECQTAIRSLYVIGDAAGYAQGNLQAMMMGIAAADSILKTREAKR